MLKEAVDVRVEVCECLLTRSSLHVGLMPSPSAPSAAVWWSVLVVIEDRHLAECSQDAAMLAVDSRKWAILERSSVSFSCIC